MTVFQWQVGILLQAKQIYCVNSHWRLEAYGKRNVSIVKQRRNVDEHKKEMAHMTSAHRRRTIVYAKDASMKKTEICDSAR